MAAVVADQRYLRLEQQSIRTGSITKTGFSWVFYCVNVVDSWLKVVWFCSWQRAPTHGTRLTQETLQKPEAGDPSTFSLQPRPRHTSDFHLFGPVKQALRGKNFRSNEEIKVQVQKRLRDQPKEFYARGVHELEERWDEHINVAGDYVENWPKFCIDWINRFLATAIRLFTHWTTNVELPANNNFRMPVCPPSSYVNY